MRGGRAGRDQRDDKEPPAKAWRRHSDQLRSARENRARLRERLQRRRRRPDGVGERDKIGAGVEQRRNVCERGGVADAGRLEYFGPPFHPFDRLVGRRREAVAPGFAEHHVIDAGLARIHGVVARAQQAGADDAFRLEAGQRLSELRGAAADMRAVRADPGGEPRIIVDEQRGAAFGHDLDEPRDDLLGVALGARREAREHAGDIAAVKPGGQGRGEIVKIGRPQGRRQQI